MNVDHKSFNRNKRYDSATYMLFFHLQNLPFLGGLSKDIQNKTVINHEGSLSVLLLFSLSVLLLQEHQPIFQKQRNNNAHFLFLSLFSNPGVACFINIKTKIIISAREHLDGSIGQFLGRKYSHT